jgi:long-chain acyl-CoA synthetase
MLLNEFLENSAQHLPLKTALICQNSRYSYAEIDSAANSFCGALVAEGFRRHDRAIIYLENSVESAVSLFGILKAGGTFVIINPRVKPRKLAYIVADCQATFLITDSGHTLEIANSLSTLPSLKALILSDSDIVEGLGIQQKFNPRLLSYTEMVAGNGNRRVSSKPIDIDLASLVYTSGSSGNPKGVMLTHLNMVSAANSITQYLENTEDDILINTLPLSFDYGLYQLLMTVKFGGTLVLEKAFTYPEYIISRVIEEKVTGWPIVPTIAAILCRLKSIEKRDFCHLRYLSSTGQALNQSHIVRLIKIFPKAKIFSMYGLTECKRVSYLPPEELGKRPASVGKAMPNTEAYIVDNNGNEITEAEKAGELVVRGANVMKGYWNLPEATDRSLRPGPYPNEKVLFTGDVFKKDNDGYLYFLGRKDDIIKTSGHMVSPKEVENVLSELSGVLESAVIGVPDEILGQAIKAFINLADDSKINEKVVLNFCKQYLEEYAIPKFITFCGPLPKTDSGKIQKQDLL